MSALASITAVNVNGRPVTLFEVLHELKVSGRLEDLLDKVVEDRIIVEAIRSEGVVISDDELQDAANEFRRVHRLQLATETQAWLARHRLSVDDLQARVEAPLLRRKLAEHLTQGRIERWFVENRAQFDRARLSLIVTEKEGVAQELLSQIVEDGEDFAVLARKYSRDESTRQTGGFLGVAARKSLSPAIEAAVFGARPGAVVGPFATSKGFHLIRIEEILPAQLDFRTTETIRELIFTEWLNKRKSQAQVDPVLLNVV